MSLLPPPVLFTLLQQKSRCGGSGFLQFYLFQIHAIGHAADLFHIIRIILQIT